MAQLVERPAIKAERLAVAASPAFEGVRVDAVHLRGEDDRGVLGLFEVRLSLLGGERAQALFGCAVGVRNRRGCREDDCRIGGCVPTLFLLCLSSFFLGTAGGECLEALTLGSFVGAQRLSHETGHGQVAQACFGLGFLEVAEAVVGVADGDYAVLDVDVAPREAADLPATHPGADREEVYDVRLQGEVELCDELPDGLGLEGAAGLGVPAWRVHLGAGVLGDDTVLHEVVEQQLERLVDLVEIGAAGGFAGEGVAGAHGGVHLLKRLSG